MSNPDYFLKIFLTGDSGTGKTNFLRRLTLNDFDPLSKKTIGIEFATKTVEIKGKTVKAQIWDTAGDDRYRAITNSYYKGAEGAFIFYDVLNLQSYNNLQKWLDEIREFADPDIYIIIIANKCDIPEEQRKVSTEQGKNFAEQHNFLFYEVSVFNFTNVEDSYMKLISEIVGKLIKKESNETKKISKTKNSLHLSSTDLKQRMQSQAKDFAAFFKQNKKDPQNQTKQQSKEISSLKQNKEDLENQIKLQSKEISSLKQNKEDLENQIKLQLKEISSLKQNKEDLENQIKLQSKEISSLKQNKEDLENQIKLQLKEISSLKQNKEDLENQVKTLKENEKQQEKTIKDLKSKSSDKVQTSNTNSFDPFESYEKISKLDTSTNYFIDSNDELNHEVIKRIGEGATSVTYKIFDKTTEKTMCKKVLKINSNTTFQNAQNAMKEFEILYTIRHPCICRAIGINTSETTADGATTIALFLEFLNYGLKDCLDQKIINNTLKTRIVIEIVHGMKFIHSKGMIHRDLKIENIMLNSVFEAKLVDFDLAKIDICVHGSSTGISMTKGIGTLAYMSPEMANEEQYSNKTDVYSFGVVLYYIYTGSLPNYSMRDKMYGKPVPLPKPSLEISQFCLDLIAKCLNANQDERPSFDDILNLMKKSNYNLAADIDTNVISKRDRELDFYENK